jgi:hypothetical protein
LGADRLNETRKWKAYECHAQTDTDITGIASKVLSVRCVARRNPGAGDDGNSRCCWGECSVIVRVQVTTEVPASGRGSGDDDDDDG